MSEEIGGLVEKSGKISVEWKVENPSQEEQECDQEVSFMSPVFSLSDSCWRLRFRRKNKKEFLALIRVDDGPPKRVSFTLSGLGCKKKVDNYTFSEESAIYEYEILNWMDLTLDISCTFTIDCTLNSAVALPLGVSLFRRLWDAGQCLRNIFAENRSTDFAFRLKSREVGAHRMILESRFPDFARKLDGEMRESPAGQIDVEDGDEDAFDIVLFYVYSGETEGLSSENVVPVYRIAQRYDLHDLRKLCTLFLEKSLSVEGVCDVIAMADSNGEVDLKERAKEFFAENSPAILRSVKWECFKKENGALFLELLEYMMKPRNK